MSGTRLKDVAERAGVSIKTVSNVVRGNVRVADATR
ncbi:MAG TPA: LacI family DNA-binding transcriptional regulator, partial [Streptomyces sp.]|nr:LacI family DNA-binding transcriptional regulator [Streptomyces sp.]